MKDKLIGLIIDVGTGAQCLSLNSIPDYTKFCEASTEMDVVQAIANIPLAIMNCEQSAPLQEVKILSINVEEG